MTRGDKVDEYVIEVAGVRVRIKSRFEKTKKYMKDYIVDGDDAEIYAFVSDEDMDRTLSEPGGSNKLMSEITGLYRPIAEAMPMKNGLVFHGAAISYKDRAFLFTAPSGTGKSTHISLWHKYLGENVEIINGDKPIISVKDDCVLICGTPWSGKEHWQKNISRELSAICILMRGNENKIERVASGEILEALLNQTYIPKNPQSLVKTLELLDKVLTSVPVYRLYCDISEEAVKCSFEGMTNIKYEEVKT